MKKNILIITDNKTLLSDFRNLVIELDLKENYQFDYAYSSWNNEFKNSFEGENWIKSVNLKNETSYIVSKYDNVFSLHCKQLFPKELVNNVKCYNVHPGLNPHNRGWFPQVFSIINGLPCGATVHEIDEQLDHGGVISQKEVKIESWDTSLTAYKKVIKTEIVLLRQCLKDILENNYGITNTEEGNLNLKKDFDELCEIDLTNKDTFANHLNRLRALTHGEYKNGFYIDENGNKIYVSVSFEKA